MALEEIQSPKIMGVINITPDSFYSKSRFDDIDIIDEKKYKYADIIDVGCESSRPGASPLYENEEIKRLDIFLNSNIFFDKPLSIDTYKPAVAKYALDNGFSIINDITGGGEANEMIDLACEYDCPIIIMHMNGTPLNMQLNPKYDDIISELKYFFEKKINYAEKNGINKKNIILDPGIGFGKKYEHNDEIIRNIDALKKIGYPIMIGASRKSFLSIDNDNPDDRLAASLCASMLLMQKGIDYIRVHDVEETYKMKLILFRIKRNKFENNKNIYN